MCYTLHYSEKTLMLSTDDRQQVLGWSERQAGEHTSMAFIIELDFDDLESLVERSGTGICAEEKIGCKPIQGMLAGQDYQSGVRKPTWH
jgi:hypothetical protein